LHCGRVVGPGASAAHGPLERLRVSAEDGVGIL
jgi:hypothetical protein